MAAEAAEKRRASYLEDAAMAAKMAAQEARWAEMAAAAETAARRAKVLLS